ncbi:MAG: 4-(cytidine 5'-diphospho)-2-C-methyl-D-erythritol kinase [Victivallales bacterium]|nr:4-(cytidine 5'-diphospho)-2-C-methyl-D-erythritol kinase [Victivallales bacterium]MCF7888812.1 4-(cytidine 5'-diphospho)-2-C-methyl-D-erythritol kinase [Victivallales bacterium]
MLKLKTPSKINLFLKVVGKLPNGYHEIETVFVPLSDIYDVITLNFDNNELNITSNNSKIPLNKDNLCYRAAELYAEYTGIKLNCSIHIDKNIPVAAGMGGGSSDAAAVLLLLNKQYGLLSFDKLKEAAVNLGADVPYFLNPVPAFAKGIGEKLERIEMADGLYTVILAPLFPVSAAWAYKNFDKSRQKKNIYSNDLKTALKAGDWLKASKFIYNDLAPALYEKFPIQEILKEEMLNAGLLNVEITGSGPTLFGICSGKQQAIEAEKKLHSKYGDTFYCGISKAG